MVKTVVCSVPFPAFRIMYFKSLGVNLQFQEFALATSSTAMFNERMLYFFFEHSKHM